MAQPILETDRLLQKSEVAKVLGVAVRTVERLIALGQLESVTIGRCRRVPMSALSAFVLRLRKAGV